MPVQALRKSTTSLMADSRSAPPMPWSSRGYRLTVQSDIVSPYRREALGSTMSSASPWMASVGPTNLAVTS